MYIYLGSAPVVVVRVIYCVVSARARSPSLCPSPSKLGQESKVKHEVVPEYQAGLVASDSCQRTLNGRK
jgi:hypothetical protein